MQEDRRALGRFVRSAALALVVAMAGAGAWTACGTSEAPTQARAEVDPGPTFGAEITVAIKGRGRVVSDPASLDCPSSCFARVVLADPTIDGAAEGLALTAQATIGSHFVGWSFANAELGVRARGPAQCSPMMRSSSVLPVPSGSSRVTLRYGETMGTPPPGREIECAGFTTVPVAYAVTATFEEDTVRPGPPPPPGPVVEVLFEPPSLGAVVGREIGVTGGRVYWRFDKQSFGSGVASGLADGKGGGSVVVVQPFDNISRFDVDRHIVFQHGNEGQNGTVETIQSGTTTRTSLGYWSSCASLASDDANAYCRTFGGFGSPTYLYSWPITGGSYSYIYTLPRGGDLAVDEKLFYFSETQNDLPSGAFVESASRFPDGGSGVPVISQLVGGQTAPRDLVVGPEYLFWLDDQGANFVTAVTAPKTGGGGRARGVPGARFLAVDPASPTTFYVGISNSNMPGDSYIVKATALSSSISSFRSGLTGIGGIAVDATHVFWTQNDGRVYRAPKD